MSTQLVKPEIDRVDAVNGPATGIPFLMFKSAEGAPAEAEEVAKSAAEEEAAEDVAEEAADAEPASVDGATVTDEAAAAAEPGDAIWEAIDAAKARVAVGGLAALGKLIDELRDREAAEGDDYENVWDLGDAKDAVDFALGVLARFSVTEQLESDDAAEDATAAARALGVIKSLHLEVHEGEPALADAPAEAPVADSIAPEAPAAPTAALVPAVKAGEPLPSGLQEILDTFVESYSAYKEAQDTGAEDGVTPDEFAAAPAAVEAPVEDAQAPEAPAAPVAPAEPVAAPAAPSHAAPAVAHEAPAAEAPAEGEDPAEKFKKSMEDAIAEAVAKATEPLLKQIDVLERTPVDSGPMLAGQTPGMSGEPLVRGQEEGAVAKGLRPANAQAAPGNSLADGLKALYAGRL